VSENTITIISARSRPGDKRGGAGGVGPPDP